MIFLETSTKIGENIEKIFINSSFEIAKRIDNEFYDLTNENCGIKQGFISENVTLNNNKSENDKKARYCCY